MSMTINASKLEYLAHTLQQMTVGTTNPRHKRLVSQALSRISSDTYGYCLVCGMSIPERELERKPERQHCSCCEEADEN